MLGLALEVVRLRGGVHGLLGVDGQGKLAVSGVGYINIGLEDRMRSLPLEIFDRVGESGTEGRVRGKLWERMHQIANMK
jgi:hypothetical protein